jgi:hypothetical protein
LLHKPNISPQPLFWAVLLPQHHKDHISFHLTSSSKKTV